MTAAFVLLGLALAGAGAAGYVLGATRGEPRTARVALGISIGAAATTFGVQALLAYGRVFLQ